MIVDYLLISLIFSWQSVGCKKLPDKPTQISLVYSLSFVYLIYFIYIQTEAHQDN